MSADARLRDLQRAATQGDPEAEERLLRERPRAGERCVCGGRCSWCRWPVYQTIDEGCILGNCSMRPMPPYRPCPRCAGLSLQQRIELAAFCGSEVARLVVGSRLWEKDGKWHDDDPQAGCRSYGGIHVPGELCEDRSFESFLRDGLSRWGDHVMLRAAIAAGWHCWDYADPAFGGGSDDARLALEAATAYRDCPCEEHREAWRWANVKAGLGTNLVWLPYAEAGGNAASTRVQTIIFCSSLVGEQPVREAICADLINWSLK